LALSGRLSRFKRPKVNIDGRRKTLHDGTKVKKPTKGKGRNFGKLVQLLDMPLDVFFEVSHSRGLG
jgi:hypothetical protein